MFFGDISFVTWHSIISCQGGVCSLPLAIRFYYIISKVYILRVYIVYCKTNILKIYIVENCILYTYGKDKVDCWWPPLSFCHNWHCYDHSWFCGSALSAWPQGAILNFVVNFADDGFVASGLTTKFLQELDKSCPFFFERLWESGKPQGIGNPACP